MQMNPTRNLEQDIINTGLLAESGFDSTLSAVKDYVYTLQDTYEQYRSNLLARLDEFKDHLEPEVEINLFSKEDIHLLKEALTATNTLLQYIANHGVALRDEAFSSNKALRDIGIRYVSIYGMAQDEEYVSRKGRYDVITDPEKVLVEAVIGTSYSSQALPYIPYADRGKALYRHVTDMTTADDSEPMLGDVLFYTYNSSKKRYETINPPEETAYATVGDWRRANWNKTVYKVEAIRYVPLGAPAGGVSSTDIPVGTGEYKLFEPTEEYPYYPEELYSCPCGIEVKMRHAASGEEKYYGIVECGDEPNWYGAVRDGIETWYRPMDKKAIAVMVSDYLSKPNAYGYYPGATSTERTILRSAADTVEPIIEQGVIIHIEAPKYLTLINGAVYSYFDNSAGVYTDLPEVRNEVTYNTAKSRYGTLYIKLRAPTTIKDFKASPAAAWLLDGLDWNSKNIDRVTCGVCGHCPVDKIYEATDTQRPIFGCPNCYNLDPGKMFIPHTVYPARHSPLYTFDPDFSWVDAIYASKEINYYADLKRTWKGWWGSGIDCWTNDLNFLMVRKPLRRSGWDTAAYDLACDLCFGIHYYDIDHKIDVDRLFGLITEKDQARALFQIANLWAIRHEIIRILATQLYKIYTKGIVSYEKLQA